MSWKTLLSEKYFRNRYPTKVILLSIAMAFFSSGCGEAAEETDVNLSKTTATLSWVPNPVSDAVFRYEIFAGSTLAEAANNSKIFVSVFQVGFDVKNPSVTYSIGEFGFKPGGTACIRLKAHNSAGASGLSDGACENIPG